MSIYQRNNSGFTIVELLIVIVVIAILAAISIVAYNGIQTRGDDSRRSSDMNALAKKLELYYVDNGSYPGSSSSQINSSSWRQTNLGISDASVTPPGASTPTIVNTSTPTGAQYGYSNSGTCTGSGASQTCTRYTIYWRNMSDNTVKTISSSNN